MGKRLSGKAIQLGVVTTAVVLTGIAIGAAPGAVSSDLLKSVASLEAQP
jgi:hypothetical protein